MEGVMELEENSQGRFRVRLPNGRIMRDEDLMMAISSNHVSKEMHYGSKGAAIEGYAYYVALRARTGIPYIEAEPSKDDWKKVKT